MKLFVDDERPMPTNGNWIISRTPAGAIQLMVWAVQNPGNRIEILSLDHDLGENVPTGYDIAAWLEKEVITKGMIPPKVLKVHSANPVGRARILLAFKSIARYCEQNGMEVPTIES